MFKYFFAFPPFPPFPHHTHRVPTKNVARVEDVPHAGILLVVTNFSCRRVFFSFRFSRLVGWAFTVTFRRVQRFVHWANAGSTATELRDKNAPWFFLASGVRIDHVIRSHSALPFSSHSLPLAPAEDVPCAMTLLVITNFRVGVFSSLFGFLVWLVEHSQ